MGQPSCRENPTEHFFFLMLEVSNIGDFFINLESVPTFGDYMVNSNTKVYFIRTVCGLIVGTSNSIDKFDH